MKVRPNLGATYNNDGDAFTILDPIPMKLEDAQLRGSEVLIPAQISYGAISRSNGKNAFSRAVDLTMEDVRKMMRKRIELGLLYGGLGLGKAASSTNQSATQTRITVTTATWQAGIWSGLSGVELNFYNAGSLVSSGADAIFTVAKLDIANRYLFVNGTATGITALDAAIAGAPNTVDAFFRGAKTVEMTGLFTIAANTGTLFNVNAVTWEQWQGNTYDVGSAPLTFEKLQEAVANVEARGLDEDVTVLISPKTYAKMNSELAGARVYDQSYDKSKGTNGVEAIEFYGGIGKISVVSHPYMKESMGLILPMKHIYRIGSTEPTFQMAGEDTIFHSTGTAGLEVRTYTDQAVFCDAIPYCSTLTGITN